MIGTSEEEYTVVRETKRHTLIINGRLPGLNDYTKACRANKFVGAKMKKECEGIILTEIKNQRIGQFKGSVRLKFRWYEKNQRRDIDNIAFAKKFILDALVTSGTIEADNWKCVVGFEDEFYVDSANPRIEVEITEEKK